MSSSTNTPSTSSDWTRLIRFISLEDGKEHLGQPVDESQDVGLAMSKQASVQAYKINASLPWSSSARVQQGSVLTVKKLLSPISSTSPTSTIRCIGLNYADHAQECGLPYPPTPVLFLKPSACIAGPNSTVPIPAIAQDGSLDWEVELAVVIGEGPEGRACKDVGEEEAMGFVLGFATANDLSSRSQQFASSQWCFGKSFDFFCPLGPTLVSPRSLPDPQALRLRTEVNGEMKQEGTTEVMIFSIKQIISYLSQGTTLAPGTVIITGTPPGVGMSMKPPQHLKDGDQIRCWISNGLDTLINDISYESKQGRKNEADAKL